MNISYKCSKSFCSPCFRTSMNTICILLLSFHFTGFLSNATATFVSLAHISIGCGRANTSFIFVFPIVSLLRTDWRKSSFTKFFSWSLLHIILITVSLSSCSLNLKNKSLSKNWSNIWSRFLKSFERYLLIDSTSLLFSAKSTIIEGSRLLFRTTVVITKSMSLTFSLV